MSAGHSVPGPVAREVAKRMSRGLTQSEVAILKARDPNYFRPKVAVVHLPPAGLVTHADGSLSAGVLQ